MFNEQLSKFRTPGRTVAKPDLPELSRREMRAVTGGLRLAAAARTVEFASYKKRQVCNDYDCSDGCCTV